ncbi:MAG TPA: T9SS type A sorting domain-containing protein, partial [Bacteroidia bacterium]|nr:T9SS type A sorting domain-containing protein [Bacteroidia bacterium]
SSNAASCGCGPYYLEVEVSASASFTGAAPAPASPLWGNYPWFHSLLNVPGYGPPTWVDNCVTEPYTTINIPLSGFCQGSTVYVRMREYVEGSSSAGPWTMAASVAIPGSVPVLAGQAFTSDSTLCSGDTSSVLVSHNGCSGNYTVSWLPTAGLSNPSGMTSAAYPTANTTYTVTFTDNVLLQTFISSVTINVFTSPSASATSTIESCGTSDADVTTTVTGGTSPYTFLWSNGATTMSLVNVSSGAYSLVVTDTVGCQATLNIAVTDSCDYVWPGDADDDAIADMNDILAIGIANASTGTTRPGATLTWIGQWSLPWGPTLISGTDYKWVDCNGDGVVDPNDTTAVILNYGLTHNNRFAAPQFQLAAPVLAVDAGQDTLAPSSPGMLTINFGDATTPADSVYGIIFSLYYDELYIDPNSISISAATSWMGTAGNDMIVVKKILPGMGRMDVAITRIDHANINGSGAILSVNFMTTSALTGTGQTIITPITLGNVRCISNDEMDVAVNTANDSLVISDAVLTSINETNGEFGLYPNPASDKLTLQFATAEERTVRLYNALGELVLVSVSYGSQIEIDLSGRAQGLYTVQVESSGTIHHREVMVVHNEK